MNLQPGQTLLHYRLVDKIGEGGMGIVWRARDATLDREVAIKLLPDTLAASGERLSRLEREAKLLASLNHSNIATVYGFHAAGDLRFLVMEFVAGEDLAARLTRGPMPVREALVVARQIAEALEAAHEQGIIHRDLKPANILLDAGDHVKVLDFGLAKAFEPDGAASRSTSLSPTVTSGGTMAGVILGTAAYMSPEQAAGQAADRRSDVWSFGVVVLEMLTGRRVFGGETVSHVLAAVLKDEPEWERLPHDLPHRLRDLLRACLRKKPRRRLQAIGDARVLIEEYVADPASFAPPAPPTPVAAAIPAAAAARATRHLPWAVAGLLALGLAGALYGSRDAAPRGAPVARLSLPGPKGEPLFTGLGTSLAISPDGSTLAYVLIRPTGRHLFVHPLNRWEPSLLEGAGIEPYLPFFSPDGQWIGYVTPAELKKMPVSGGSPLTLCALNRSRGASWGEDGKIVFAASPRGGLSRVSSAGGEPEPLTVLDEAKKEVSHRWPQVLPGGEAVLFTSTTDDADFAEATLELFLLRSKERRLLHKGGSNGRYVSSGHIVYLDGRTLFAFPFDLASLTATGSPAPVLEGVSGSQTEGGAQFDVSEDGTLVYAEGSAGTDGTRVVWVDGKGVATPLWDASQEYATPALSPDGRRLAVQIRKEGDEDLWVYDLDRGVPMRLTFDRGRDASPVWSPDGETIFYGSEREGLRGIYRRPSDGSGEPEVVLRRERNVSPTSISPDGKTLAFYEEGDVWLLPLAGGEPTPFLSGPSFEGGATFSPDGRWILYHANEAGSFHIFVRPASGGRGKWQISAEVAGYPLWSGDGRAIYYRSQSGEVLKTAVDTSGGGFQSGRPVPLFNGPYEWTGDGITRYTIAPDGERFVMLARSAQADSEHDHIRVVLNWFAELRDRRW